MEQKLNIRIPEPCHENWDQMGSMEKGRFCNACSKIVVDFTAMQDNEIINYFNDAAGSRVCGRFRQTQLATPVAPALIPHSRFSKFFSPLQRVAAVLITGMTLFMSSCKPSVKGETSVGKAAIDSSFSGTTDSALHLQGDTVTEQPKPVKKPHIKGSDIQGDVIVTPPVMQGISIMEPDPESFPMGKIVLGRDSIPAQPEK